MLELKRGNLRAELEWEIPTQVSRDGTVAVIAKGVRSFSLTMRGRVYADPSRIGDGVYLCYKIQNDHNCAVNAANAAHYPEPEPSGTPFTKMQTVSLTGEDSAYKIYGMLMYAERTAEAKEYFDNHPDERVYLGVVKHEGQSGPVIPPPSDEDGLIQRILAALQDIWYSEEIDTRIPLTAGLAIGGASGVYLALGGRGMKRYRL